MKQNLKYLHNAILGVQTTLSNIVTATLPPPIPPKPSKKTQRIHTTTTDQQETRIDFIPPQKLTPNFPQYDPISP
jgi:hypothetical protein